MPAISEGAAYLEFSASQEIGFFGVAGLCRTGADRPPVGAPVVRRLVFFYNISAFIPDDRHHLRAVALHSLSFVKPQRLRLNKFSSFRASPRCGFAFARHAARCLPPAARSRLRPRRVFNPPRAYARRYRSSLHALAYRLGLPLASLAARSSLSLLAPYPLPQKSPRRFITLESLYYL